MVTAIISAYKTELNQLAGRLLNLANQTDVELEVVIVYQKGSPEDGFLKESDLVEEANHILVETEDLPTIYAAWNLGIQASTGEFITNANSDDLLYPNALSVLTGVLQNDPQYALAYANSDITHNWGSYPVSRYVWAEGGLEELLKHCFIGPMPVWRRSLHEKYGLFDAEMHSAGDYEFWLRLASSGEKFLHLKRVLGIFYHNNDSASMREPLRSKWESARARSRYSKSYEE